ncbi:hypothetical protein Celal_0657 [Cellulophaga algicola DSM 14237]|uniref:Uncharacterized protein n=1 Tax=Cellulophaga algicola (strain DSM 14237 / IC166 / ACAM 630) TaxID=688270 RepID=E6XD83_CELAD|nr:hypothetical protein [Cellulophaga algicola]ADV47996.1 hypothetical protein Celal_0657 [Cellulophaga algicola DSM 14237]
MKVSITSTSIKQKGIVKILIFTTIIGGFVLYKLGYMLGQLIYNLGY